jgi:hypothetical protein
VQILSRGQNSPNILPMRKNPGVCKIKFELGALWGGGGGGYEHGVLHAIVNKLQTKCCIPNLSMNSGVITNKEAIQEHAYVFYMSCLGQMNSNDSH